MRPKRVQVQVTAMVEGMKRHGLNPEILPADAPQQCDIAIAWGVKRPLLAKKAARMLVLERGYVGDRFAFTSVGWDGLNGLATFAPGPHPDGRWLKYFSDRMQPWRSGHDGQYVLIMGQVPGDASLRGLDTNAWCQHIARHVFANGLTPCIRLHPLNKHGISRGIRHLIDGRPWADVLAGARWVVAYNSNSAVDAVLDGVPTVTCDRGSMAWSVTDHDPVKPPATHDREQWAYDLAYTQWTIEELQSGEAWECVKNV